MADNNLPPQESTRGNEKPDNTAEGDGPQPVWTYRGYKLRSSEFTTAMVHQFRAEVQRANVWRQRLDTTTNWAVVTTGAVISIAFTGETAPHLVIILNLLLVTFFLSIESRRYRYFELWSYRIRLMETDFFAAMLVPPFHPAADWAESLAENLLHPHYPITYTEALGRRLRRNYLWIYGVIYLAWFAKIWLQPTTAINWAHVVRRASIGGFSGQLIMGVMIGIGVFLALFAVITIRLQEATGEVLPRYAGLPEEFASVFSKTETTHPAEHAWYRKGRRRRQFMTIIITDQAEAVSARIIKDMARGVTALTGKGMYTGKEHQILLVALTTTEIPHMKELVRSVDENAFVIVSPAQEILGRGFLPLEEIQY
ncbi:MAG TPA: DUF2270 domain-containing protein [Anaerolineales bacterium]|nr:DUF2270 domain-containing protein [Anaerolineales bacterium]